MNSFFREDALAGFKDLCTRLEQEPFVMSRIYGLFKPQKEGCPVRPIVSSTDCMARPLCDWMLKKLDVIASHVGKRQVKNSHELFSKVDRKDLGLR